MSECQICSETRRILHSRWGLVSRSCDKEDLFCFLTDSILNVVISISVAGDYSKFDKCQNTLSSLSGWTLLPPREGFKVCQGDTRHLHVRKTQTQQNIHSQMEDLIFRKPTGMTNVAKLFWRGPKYAFQYFVCLVYLLKHFWKSFVDKKYNFV